MSTLLGWNKLIRFPESGEDPRSSRVRDFDGSSLARIQSDDPLHCKVALEHGRIFYPYGFPVHVRSNAPAVIAAADQSWGHVPQSFDEGPIEIRFTVEGEGQAVFREPSVRAQRNLLVSVADQNNHACCDLREGLGTAWVTKSVARNAPYLRYHFLEAMAYGLLEVLYLVSIHAACVERNGKGVLLVGESGAGKSSLAYECARSGWTYITDDASSLVRRSHDRVVLGTPERFRFRPSAGDMFPEFKGAKESKRANGKPTLEVLTSTLPWITTGRRCQVHAVVFLNRSNPRGASSLSPIQAEEALGRMFANVWPVELSAVEEQVQAVKRLLDVELYEMKYHTLDEAMALLEEITGGRDNAA